MTQEYNTGKLNILQDEKKLRFRDEENKDKVLSEFHKRCIKIIEA